MPRRALGVSTITESDIISALSSVHLRPNTENAGFRGCDRGIDGRYVWWPKRVGPPIPYLDLGCFRATTSLTRPTDNGNVKWQLEFRGATRAFALGALKEAVRLLMDRD